MKWAIGRIKAMDMVMDMGMGKSRDMIMKLVEVMGMVKRTMDTAMVTKRSLHTDTGINNMIMMIMEMMVMEIMVMVTNQGRSMIMGIIMVMKNLQYLI